MDKFGPDQLDDNIATVFEDRFEAVNKVNMASSEARQSLNSELDSLNADELVDLLGYATTEEDLATTAWFSIRRNLDKRIRLAEWSNQIEVEAELNEAKDTSNNLYKTWLNSDWRHDPAFRYKLHPKKFTRPLIKLFECIDLADELKVAESSVKDFTDDLTPEEMAALVEPTFSPSVDHIQASWVIGDVLIANYMEALKTQNKSDLMRYAAALTATGDEGIVDLYKDWKPEQ